MADNFININTTDKARAQRVRELLDTLERDLDRLATLKDALNQMTDGVTFTTIETEFGLNTGKGQPFYNLVVGAAGEIAAATNLTNLRSYTAALY